MSKAIECGATTDASDFACRRPKDHDLSPDPAKVRHNNGAGLSWASTRRKLLDAASPALADSLEEATKLLWESGDGIEWDARIKRFRAVLRAAGRPS